MFTDQKLKDYNDREERFKLAIEEAQANKTASINSIANKYKVSRTTLSRRLHGFKNTRTSHEKQQKFTNEEEMIIIEQVNQLLRTNSQIPQKKEILLICEDLLKNKYANQPPNENERFFKVGKNWIDRFLERHNDKLMINEKTSLCEYYKYEFLQRKKLRSNADIKSENSSPSADNASNHDQDQQQYHNQQQQQQQYHHQQQQQHHPRPMITPSNDYMYPTASSMEQVVMNIPNGFVIPNLMPQNSFSQDPNSANGWPGINSVPMKHSTTGFSQSNQSLNFQFPPQSSQYPQQAPPPQQQQQQQAPPQQSTPTSSQQPQLARGINSLGGFGPANSILNNHGVHLNGNAVVNIYPEINGPQGTTPTNNYIPPNNYVPPNYNHGINNYALQQQQDIKPRIPPTGTTMSNSIHSTPTAPATAATSAPPTAATDTGATSSATTTLDLMELYQGDRFQYDLAHARIINEIEKLNEMDAPMVVKLVNLSFEQFEKDLQQVNNQNNTNSGYANNTGNMQNYWTK